MDVIRFTDEDDTIALGSDATLLGRGGDDLYTFLPGLTPADATIRIGDTQGRNTLRLPDGVAIAGSEVVTLANGGSALRLTLTNATTVQIDNAEAFAYEVGGSVSGVGTTVLDFESFVTGTLGASVPAPDELPAQGGPVTIGAAPSLSGEPTEVPPSALFAPTSSDPHCTPDCGLTDAGLDIGLSEGLAQGDSDFF